MQRQPGDVRAVGGGYRGVGSRESPQAGQPSGGNKRKHHLHVIISRRTGHLKCMWDLLVGKNIFNFIGTFLLQLETTNGALNENTIDTLNKLHTEIVDLTSKMEIIINITQSSVKLNEDIVVDGKKNSINNFFFFFN